MRSFVLLLICTPVCLASPPPIENIEAQCGQELQWNYCIYQTPGSKSRDLIYYLHGRHGDVHEWNDRDHHTGKIYRFMKDEFGQTPTVISVSYGNTWLLMQNPAEKEGGLQKVFLEKIIPNMEKKLDFEPRARMLWGISMGGVNTLLTSFAHPHFFEKSVSICPPIMPASHHEGWWATFQHYWKSPSMSLKRFIMLSVFSRKFFPDRDLWELNSPFARAEKMDVQSAPHLYLSCGAADDWDCMTGSKALVQILERRKIPMTWVPRPGGHCDIDHHSVAKFLAEG